MKKRAVISVADARNVSELAVYLHSDGWDILSTGRTAEILKELHIPFTDEKSFSDSTKTVQQFSAIVQDILATGHNTMPDAEAEKDISLICINLQPQFNKIREFQEVDSSVNCIDMRSSGIIQAAAKNYNNVIVLTDPDDYKETIIQLKTQSVSAEYRLYLAGKAFNMVSAYNAAIADSIIFQMSEDEFPRYLTVPYERMKVLQSGTNPQQKACIYDLIDNFGALNGVKKIQGKEITYSIIVNMYTAWKYVCKCSSFMRTSNAVESFTSDGNSFTTQFTPATGTVFTTAIKYNNPIGAALGPNAAQSFIKTYNCDRDSAEGAVIGCGAVVDEQAAAEMIKTNPAAVIAPDFTEGARAIFAVLKDLRLVAAEKVAKSKFDFSSLDGGVLVQSIDEHIFEKLRFVTKQRPNQKQIDEMLFGMLIAMDAKTESAVFVKDMAAIGISCAQPNTNRCIDEALFLAQKAVQQGLTSSSANAEVLVSDGVLKFSDSVRRAAESGVKAIIQTGGSPDDAAFINFCDEHSISMIFTDIPHISF